MNQKIIRKLLTFFIPPGALRGLFEEVCILLLSENTYYVEIHVLVCTIKMKKMKFKKIAIHFCITPGYPRKKLRTAVRSNLACVLL